MYGALDDSMRKISKTLLSGAGKKKNHLQNISFSRNESSLCFGRDLHAFLSVHNGF